MYYKQAISNIYYDLLEDVAYLKIPQEEWVDCGTCHFCLNSSQERFHTKCCDYQPSLANFIVGGILNDFSDNLSIGNELLRKRIKNRHGVTPYGVLPTTVYNETFRHSRANEKSMNQKQTTALKCSFLHHGDCSIYKYRSDMCGNFFCKSISFNHGINFWEDARKMNFFLDKTIALLMAKKLGISILPDPSKGLKSFSSLIETDLGEIDELRYKKLWGDWYNKEEIYYKKCHTVFKSINTKDLKNELGEAFEKLKSSIIDSAVPFNEHRVNDFLFFEEQKWLQVNNSDKLGPLLLMYLRLFNGKNKTADIVKQAAQMQIDLSKTIKELLEEGFLRKSENSFN